MVELQGEEECVILLVSHGGISVCVQRDLPLGVGLLGQGPENRVRGHLWGET